MGDKAKQVVNGGTTTGGPAETTGDSSDAVEAPRPARGGKTAMTLKLTGKSESGLRRLASEIGASSGSLGNTLLQFAMLDQAVVAKAKVLMSQNGKGTSSAK